MHICIYIGEVVNRWLRHHFNRKSRAKCLILIGPTGTGKTSFAKSLPGRYNYFAGRWRLDSWNDFARYSIFDDIEWDKFDDLGFPSKKHLLTQNGPIMVCNKILSHSLLLLLLLLLSFIHSLSFPFSLCRLQININQLKKLLFDNQQLSY